MTDNMEKISYEHRKTLMNLSQEKEQQRDHLKAVQVRRTKVHEASH